MTRASALAELIDRLEKASGPDRDLDLAIAIAVHRRTGVLVMRYNQETEQNEEYTHWQYTKIADDAMSLLPWSDHPGATFTLRCNQSSRDQYWYAEFTWPSTERQGRA